MKNIYINQLGYINSLRKKAVFTGPAGPYEIIDAKTGKVLMVGDFEKTSAKRKFGESISVADFSSFQLKGEYYIKKGLKHSPKFKIADYPFENLKDSFLKFFYYNRCDEINSSLAGDYAHGKCHGEESFNFEDEKSAGDFSGGWHFSGDFSKYVTHSCVSLANLLYSYKLFGSLFYGKSKADEGISDEAFILSECRFELLWLLKMQDKNGGVHHGVSALDEYERTFPTKDRSKQFVFPITHHATLNFTSVMALASRIYAPLDREFSELLESAAFSAWVWLANNPECIPAEKYTDITTTLFDNYIDYDFSDDRFWAVCELYALTGEEDFLDEIIKTYKKINVSEYRYKSLGGYGALAYMTSKRKILPEISRYIHLAHRVSADNLLFIAKKNEYNVALLLEEFTFGSNNKIMDNAITLIFSYIYLKCDDYLELALEQMDYILGKNPCGRCFVTGFGSFTVMNPYHNASISDNEELPVPGMMVTGACVGGDSYMRWNVPSNISPARSYLDNEFATSVNSVTILGNSSAFFVSSFLSTIEDYRFDVDGLA